MINLKRLGKSFIYACRGLFKVFKEEQNFRIEVVMAIIVIAIAYWLDFDYWEMAILIIVISLVLLMEIINSAIELISDVLKPKLDYYVKQIKDMVATAVMIAVLMAILVGILLFGHHWYA